MRKITYLKTAFKALSEYEKDTRRRIVGAIEKIPQGDIKRLQGEKYPPLYRLRIDSTDQALIDFCMNEADGIYYVYGKKLNEMVSINMQNRNSRDFCHWIRALSLIAQFRGWAKYEQEYVDWILTQRNREGLWEFPKKFTLFALSNSWVGKNRAIDSTIFVLRLLLRKRAF